MAFRSEAKTFILPFPARIAMHDQWVGLCCCVAGTSSFIGEKLIDYRRHERTVTQLKRGSFLSAAGKRVRFVFSICVRLPRIWYWRLHQGVNTAR